MNHMTLSSEQLAQALPGLLQSGGQVPIAVTGYSMRPMLRQGRDIVWLSGPSGHYRRGQILLYRRGSRVILHRVRKVLPGNRYRMNGDALTSCETIHEDQVIAFVTGIQRGDRHISCDSLSYKLWNMIWYPTRMVRPFLFRLGCYAKKLFVKRSSEAS